MMRPLLLPASLSLLLLAGCAVGPDYQRPVVELPDAYRETPSKIAGETRSFAERDWRSVFTDPQLQQLIEEALKAGPDALLGAARVREAEALAGVARAPLFPQAQASLSTSATERAPGDRFTSTFLGGVGISWEVDLWGRYRRASEAGRADLLASKEARHGLNTSLIGSVADYYYQLAALRRTLAVTQRSADNQRHVLRLVQQQIRAGISSAAEEHQQKSALGATEARIPVLRQQIAETENALSVLLGRAPGTMTFAAPADLEIPDLVPPGLPSALLERRPDIRQAEAGLIAANARVGEARALFFPNLSLTALFGGVSTSLSDVLNGKAPGVASVGPNLLQPLFAGGRIYFNQEAALARLEQAVVIYRKTILGALGEVANALTAFDTTAEVMEIQARRVVSSREAMRLAEMRFQAGTTSFLEVLDAQRQLLSAETDEAQSLLDRRKALIRLYLALGGGWQEDAKRP
ncbi:outer membrane protein, multidrug efflux system [Formivibrio citricus]|uniref:Outer membrane protein, multidrug efflux system n=1 Tax=Formivibrio citricus TaxID=83765 RepID=A0A1I4V3C7_9NEIS|nr:efflux transporter outer membrane subunit [Formivibrio citricus]SFM95682.1 outer membrane protein, multidrug efflux system [Formivibrio citricus]